MASKRVTETPVLTGVATGAPSGSKKPNAHCWSKANEHWFKATSNDAEPAEITT